MEQIIDKTFKIQKDSILEEQRIVTLYASTVDEDRDGDTIQPTAYDLTKLQGLPILLNHNPDKLVGTIQTGNTNARGLVIQAYIGKTTQLAIDTWNLIKEGILKFASVGFRILSAEPTQNGRNITKVDLIETSLTPTPSNLNARILATKIVKSDEYKNIFENEFLKEKISKLEKDIENVNKQIVLDENSDLGKVILRLGFDNANLKLRIEQLEKELEKNKKVEDFEKIKSIEKRIDKILQNIR